MRKLYLFFTCFFLFFLAQKQFAQVSAYSFSQSVGTYTEITGGTVLGNTSTDDQRFVDPSVPLGGSTSTGPGFPIGFNFEYNGNTYDRFAVNANGWICLGQSALTPSVDMNTSSAYTPLASTATNTPSFLRSRIAGMGRDLVATTGAELRIETIGSAPNRQCVIQWKGYHRFSAAGTGAGDNFNFQIVLNETSNVINVMFGSMTFGTSSSTNTHVGLGGTLSTDFNNRTTTTDWNATTAGATNAVGCTISSTVTVPANGRTLTWTPPAPCTTPPAGGTTIASSNPACTGVNFDLSVTGDGIGTGLTYQWQSSPDGTTWTDIGGATAAMYTANQTVATWYRRRITCSGVDGFSTALQVTMAPPTSCYCAAGATSTSFEKISNVTFNTINNNSASTAGYENFTAITTTVTAGATYPISVSISGAFSSDQVLVWIDFNQDGDFFDPGEDVYISATGVGPHAGNISIPTTATAGNTRMRVRMHDSSLGANGTPCGNSSYGQVEDYTVNIFIPPCTIICPANITVNNDANQCGAIVNYPAPTTTGVCGPVTTTPASGSFFPVGTTTVTATEPGGGICTFTITVVDAQAPVITCPANMTVSNTSGICGAIVNFTPTATDNCPGTVITSSPASGSVFPVGTTTVTSTATDPAGNTASCTFTVTVNDTQNPTITCPANITVGNDVGQCGAVVNYSLPTYSDNCGLPGPVILSQTTSNSIGPAIQIGCQVAGPFTTDNSYWRAYNLASYGLAGSLTINSVTFGIENANANGTGTTQPVDVRLYTSAGAFPGGARTLIASQTVQVSDQTNTLYTVNLTTPPTVPANAILVYEVHTPDGRSPVNNAFFIGSNNLGQTAPCYISAADCGVPTPVTLASLGFPNMHIVMNISGNVAGPNPLTLVSGLAPGSTFPVGTTTNTYRVTDGVGNTATCSFDVTVNDVQAPTITCPGNITVTTPVGSCTATVNYTVTSSDNCPGVTQALQSGLASGSAFPLGVNTVTWRATDAAGNVSTCTFTVTVLDGQLPVISVQPANRTACEGTNAVFSVTATNVVTYQWQSFNSSTSTWNNISGATSSTYTVSNVNVGMNTQSYRVVITGLCTTVISNHATLYVNRLPSIQLFATPTPVLLPGQTTTITASTNPSGGSYAWFFNGSQIATSSSLSGIGVDGIGTYHLVYTDPNGCVNTSSDLVVSGAPSGDMWVYPNPNQGEFTVRYYNSANEPATVNVYDSRGAKVYQSSTVTGSPYSDIHIKLPTLTPSGGYLVELVNGSGKRIGAKWITITR
ncbi:MAG TPA: HYR domain-containing protein [Chitinophagaceae bacterium]|nr:HYR domain-containing protein [Chitinophagaceae bacterium]